MNKELKRIGELAGLSDNLNESEENDYLINEEFFDGYLVTEKFRDGTVNKWVSYDIDEIMQKVESNEGIKMNRSLSLQNFWRNLHIVDDRFVASYQGRDRSYDVIFKT